MQVTVAFVGDAYSSDDQASLPVAPIEFSRVQRVLVSTLGFDVLKTGSMPDFIARSAPPPGSCQG